MLSFFFHTQGAGSAEPESFSSLDYVRPPVALRGQWALTLVNDQWVECTVSTVRMERIGRRRLWAWRYEVLINGVHALWWGHEGQIRKWEQLPRHEDIPRLA